MTLGTGFSQTPSSTTVRRSIFGGRSLVPRASDVSWVTGRRLRWVAGLLGIARVSPRAEAVGDYEDLCCRTRRDLRALAEGPDAEMGLSAELVGATGEVGSLPAVTAELRRSAGALAELCNGSSSPIKLFEVSHAVHYVLVRLDDLVQLDECHKACLAHPDASKAKSVSFPGSSS